MDFVLAKIKRAQKHPVVKVLADDKLYEEVVIDAAACVPYDPDHNLDEESWFVIPKFSEQAFCIDFLKSPFDSKNHIELKKSQFDKIAWLCSVQNEAFYFQKVTPSLLIRRKSIIFGEVAELDDGQLRLVINRTPDAIYLPKIDSLAFKNLATISGIFKGIDLLFKEATQQEVEEFLKEPFIELSNDFDASRVSSPNRKRIGLAMATLAALPPNQRAAMVGYIDEYCTGHLTFDKTKGIFDIGSDHQLKLLIYGIEQRFYTTLFGNEKRLANSVQIL
ncbi:ATP F0F1 synthase synthase [Pseudomonas sp. PNPG3]|uniref:ATP F0F1 synthase synthase n=1 Tax=Pseudomonas sp. PNPG3 TaxID=2919497 RepID=UPI001FFC2DFF|nr:ATP F0F1 synthase synthase [Pseudomonas sp. PNPG3]MCK2121154.1 ATP F0F1 synthase synthase [Pseudomonas sp. PNPG3]